MKTKILLFIGICTCGVQFNSSAQNDNGSDIKIPEGKALIYIYRPAFAGSIINMKTYCDGVLLGTTRGKEYLYAIVEKGKHTLTSAASNSDVIDISVEAGETYYVHQRAITGFPYAATRFDIHDEEKSIRKLNRCRLAKRINNTSPTD